VDPAARDYILETILNNYNEEGTILISTHLIADIEKILDQVIFLKDGQILKHAYVDDLREEKGKSIDQQFREMFHAQVYSERVLPESDYDRRGRQKDDDEFDAEPEDAGSSDRR